MNFSQTHARTIKSLEWERLKSYLASQASSLCSRELCLALEPMTEKLSVERALDETKEAHKLLSSDLDYSQQGLPDLREHFNRLGSGASLSAQEFLDIKRLLLMARRQKVALNSLTAEEFPVFHGFSNQIYVLDDLVRAIEKIVDEGGSIHDGASQALGKLRADSRRLTAKIKDELLKIINSSALSKYLQEPIYTQRNGRYVLPVGASYRQSIDGIVHDSSASGLTVYLEPLSVIELTNKIRLMEADIEREIERLLLELSNQIRSHLEKIEESFSSLVQIDFIWARALLGSKYSGRPVPLASSGVLKLLRARHPLLVLQNGDLDSVIPNDIVLGGDLRTLVITGPNTGGKTVYLKTAGLMALMQRAGLLLPVAESSEAAIFPLVVADIGDEQSLEQNLSTFSSHLGSIIDILHRADHGSLVLLDEIGAGTDPREGVILARVILSELKKSGSITICSTHYGDLKTLAHEETGFSNASMEFDETTLRPTYKMQLGIPGSSRAIAIASRLGLPEKLVQQAEFLLQLDKKDFEIKIEELEAKLKEMHDKESQILERELIAADLEAAWRKRKNDLEEEIRKFKQDAASTVHAELKSAKTAISELTARLQKEPSLAKAQKAQQELVELKQNLGWLDNPAEISGAQKFQKGQSVKIKSLGQSGVIDTLPHTSSGSPQAVVLVGSMKIKAKLSDLELLHQQKKQAPVTLPKKKNQAFVPSTSCFVRSGRNTIDLRGKRVDEALAETVKFVDACYLEQISPLMIIHGHGTGAVKSVVRDFLHTSTYEAVFRPGETFEGGDGVTIVQFN